MKIKQIEIEKVNPANYNPRAISEPAFNGLKQSIKRFGFVDPLVINTKTGNLVSGHQRLKAAQELEYKTVPVVEVNLSEAEEKALNITLNNTAITGSFTDALQDLLAEIKNDLEAEFSELRLDALEINIDWNDTGNIDDIEPNLDGITSTIKVTCAQEIKDEVKNKIKEVVAHLEGVTIS